MIGSLLGTETLEWSQPICTKLLHKCITFWRYRYRWEDRRPGWAMRVLSRQSETVAHGVRGLAAFFTSLKCFILLVVACARINSRFVSCWSSVGKDRGWPHRSANLLAKALRYWDAMPNRSNTASVSDRQINWWILQSFVYPSQVLLKLCFEKAVMLVRGIYVEAIVSQNTPKIKSLTWNTRKIVWETKNNNM